MAIITLYKAAKKFGVYTTAFRKLDLQKIDGKYVIDENEAEMFLKFGYKKFCKTCGVEFRNKSIRVVDCKECKKKNYREHQKINSRKCRKKLAKDYDEEILPCPECGGKNCLPAEDMNSIFITCFSCGYCGRNVRGNSSRYQEWRAIKYWNEGCKKWIQNQHVCKQ